jgi:hypothetical protein
MYINNVYRAWNTAGKMAKGDYIIFLNSDFGFSDNWSENLIKNMYLKLIHILIIQIHLIFIFIFFIIFCIIKY